MFIPKLFHEIVHMLCKSLFIPRISILVIHDNAVNESYSAKCEEGRVLRESSEEEKGCQQKGTHGGRERFRKQHSKTAEL